MKLSSEIFYRQLSKFQLRGHKNEKKIVSVPEKEKIQSNDIRLLFKRQEENNKNQDKSKETNETIVID